MPLQAAAAFALASLMEEAQQNISRGTILKITGLTEHQELPVGCQINTTGVGAKGLPYKTAYQLAERQAYVVVQGLGVFTAVLYTEAEREALRQQHAAALAQAAIIVEISGYSYPAGSTAEAVKLTDELIGFQPADLQREVDYITAQLVRYGRCRLRGGNGAGKVGGLAYLRTNCPVGAPQSEQSEPEARSVTVEQGATSRRLVLDAGDVRDAFPVGQTTSARAGFNSSASTWAEIPLEAFILSDPTRRQAAQFVRIRHNGAAQVLDYRGPFLLEARNPFSQVVEDTYLDTVQQLADFLTLSGRKAYGGALTVAAPDTDRNGPEGLYFVGLSDQQGQPDQWRIVAA